jgi:hypothetical protein
MAGMHTKHVGVLWLRSTAIDQTYQLHYLKRARTGYQSKSYNVLRRMLTPSQAPNATEESTFTVPVLYSRSVVLLDAFEPSSLWGPDIQIPRRLKVIGSLGDLFGLLHSCSISISHGGSPKLSISWVHESTFFRSKPMVILYAY